MDRKVCILLPRTGVYPGLGAMLAETFSGAGWQAAVCHQARIDVLDQDLLLLVGQCRNIDGLPKVLRQRQGKRPVTALWQLEPLPPAELSSEGERIGLRAAAFDWGRMPRTARRVLNLVVPFRTKLMRTGQRWLARPYSKRVILESGHQGWERYDVDHYVVALAEWRWISRARAGGWVDHYFASNRPRVQFLRSRGIQAETIPVGYHEGWGRDLQSNRDIDVLFLGNPGRDPRGVALQQLNEQLALRGRRFTLVRGAYGKSREQWLNRARIVLSLLRLPHDLAGMRVLLGMACGALVVSEHCNDTDAYRPGEHFVMANLNELPGVIDYYLAHEDERQKIARQGHRFVTQELTLSNMLRKMLQQIETTAPS